MKIGIQLMILQVQRGESLDKEIDEINPVIPLMVDLDSGKIALKPLALPTLKA
jgi:hypothetical protein